MRHDTVWSESWRNYSRNNAHDKMWQDIVLQLVSFIEWKNMFSDKMESNEGDKINRMLMA